MPVFIDGHVHIYPDFSLDQFLSAAWANFSRVSAADRASGKTQFVLALTESEGFNVFDGLKQQAVAADESGDSGNTVTFSFHRTAEPESLIVHKGDICMVLVAGRQLVSTERLELLSLFSSFSVKDRTLTLADLAETVVASGGLPVIPWGAGKWFGERGREVNRLLHSDHGFPLFLGDSGNRPSFWPEGALFAEARDLCIPILSGSDPLPLPSHVDRAGSFGTFIPHGQLSMEQPVASLRQLLSDEKEITRFGIRIGALRFLLEQLSINMGR
jgi:hypothetical protein